MKSVYKGDTYTPMVIEALFTITKIQDQPRYPSKDTG
jgi:hypothetical protein